MPEDAIAVEMLSTPAQFAARPSENPHYKFGYNQQKDILALRQRILDNIEEDHGSEPLVYLDGMPPREFCAANFQIFRKENVVVTRPRVDRKPKLLYGFGYQETGRSIYGRFGLPNKDDILELGGKIQDIMDKMVEPDSELIRKLELKSAVAGTTPMLEKADPAQVVPNTGGVIRKDFSGTQIYQRVVIIQRDQEASHNEWFAVLV